MGNTHGTKIVGNICYAKMVYKLSMRVHINRIGDSTLIPEHVSIGLRTVLFAVVGAHSSIKHRNVIYFMIVYSYTQKFILLFRPLCGIARVISASSTDVKALVIVTTS